jgi:16S rRNA (cytidine1402-2'-O)-methyltransferase
MAGSLYVVSTPIGNLDDMTVRAVNTLKTVAVVAAEDTRRTGLLLRHFGIATPTTSLHEHNETRKIPALLETLAEGRDVAIVSDAGTPLVCDPGQRLVAAAIQQNIAVIPIPGASAILAGLAASGYPAEQFVFAGFAPSRSKDRKKWLQQLSLEPRTVIFFDAPHRISSTIADISALFGERPITLARELTKLHETVIHTTANQLTRFDIPTRGEFTIILGPAPPAAAVHQVVDDEALRAYFDQMTEVNAMPRRAAIVATGKLFGLSPNEVYARLERVKAAHLDRSDNDLLP